MKQTYIWVAIVTVLLFAAVMYVRRPRGVVMNNQQTQVQPTQEQAGLTKPPDMQIDVTKKYTATLMTTEGKIIIALTAKETPKTVNNFVYLARKGFYVNTPFHRVIPGFMIQGGDPKGNGTGGPGYRFDDEPFTGTYTRGTVAMANAGPDTNGSQFFIVQTDTDLPHDYVIFGKVTEGLGVVDAISKAETIQDGRENSRPVKPVIITSVEIAEND
jgi:peptidylprolyl isomerase